MAENTVETNHLELATELTIAWLSNPNTRASGEEVPSFLQTMHKAVMALSSSAQKAGGEDEGAQPEFTAAVSVRKSLASKDHIISLIDGKPYKTLRRHLARHGLTPDQYRERYNLKSDYPMVAENYAEVRRNLAKKIGLGRKRRTGAPAGQPATASATVPAESAAKPRVEADGAKSRESKPAASSGTQAKPRRKAREASAPKAAEAPAAKDTSAKDGARKPAAPKTAGKGSSVKAAASKSGGAKAGSKA